MAYYEGEISPIGTGYNNSGFGGGDGWWGIILLALLFGWGRGGTGFGGYGGAGNEALGYELGKVATTNDVASGFNNSAVLSNLNDLKLGQTQGFAGVQQTLCQGFNGINTSLMQGFHGVDNAICTLGYNIATGFNGVSRQIADCCCETKGAIADLKYSNERQTCDILQAINGNTQRVIDYMQNEKINALTAENVALKGRISNANQTADIVAALAPKAPVPAYAVPNPNCCYNFCGCNGQNTIL